MEGGKVQLFIPDASVVVKWFVSEEDSERARQLKAAYVEGRVNLLAPRLLEYETMNALRFHPFVKFSRFQLQVALTALRQMALMTDPPDGAWGRAIELSLLEGISVYDAGYLALADTAEGRMLTSDSVLLGKLSKSSRGLAVLLRELLIE